ncbi:exonuclease SbcC [Secundilactobacillus oryzae JCM 18671]|uniref:Nuclease SbcCD subunit C n=1 Tax=Secundilactobacillus oryzae JCM 18671 TaxID=1291743 RepID=A0A081BGD8_9LACO|nr:SMC family ATPase [Secundilactobacillus oryzae]GAK47106.1 exonuclease SbcC [Secundilactobacillus oryzae JCM 18671]
MKPQKLELHYFGPYRDEMIDFTTFSDFPVFLISGKTGAGKTTIFDAMVFALFGETSGKERDGKQMRADFATAEDETSVRFTFAHEGQTYEIERKPEQTVQKKNGGGRTDRPAKVTLTVYDATGQEVDQLTKINPVNDYVKNLLQLTASQFKQIILIPQGKFREFLTASSGDKEVILRDLFGTSLFENWAEALKTMLAEKKKTNASLEQNLGFLQQQLKWSDDNQVAATALGLATEQIALMKEQQTQAQIALTEKAQESKRAETKLNEARLKLTNGQKLTEQLQKLAELQLNQQSLTEEADHMAALKTHLGHLKWAQTLQGKVENWQTATNDLAKLTTDLATIDERLKRKNTDLASAQLRQAELTNQQDAMATLTKQLGKLEAVRGNYEKLTSVEAGLKTQNEKLASLKQEQLTVSESLTANQQAVTQLQETIAKESALLKQQTELKLQLNQLNGVAEQTRVVNNLQAQVTESQVQVTQATQIVQSAQQTHDDYQAAYEAVNQKWLTQEIARLSAQLEPGTPCPVCGATEHPAPALTTTIDVSEAEVKTAEEQLNQATTALSQAQQDLRAVETTLTERQQQAKNATDKLNQLAELPEGQSVEVALSDAQQKLSTTERDLEEIGQAKQDLRSLTAKVEAKQQQVEELRAHQSTEQLQQTALETQQRELLQQLPADLPTVEAYQARLTALQGQNNTYEAELKAAKEAVDELRTSVTQDTVNLGHTQTAIENRQAEIKTVTQQLTTATEQELQTTDLAELVHLIQQLDQVATIQQQSDQFRQRQSEIEGELKQAKATIGDQSQPDLTVLDEAVAEAEQAYHEASQAHYDAQQVIKANEELVHQMAKLVDQQTDQIKQLNELAALSEVVNGNGSQRLSLERYVLRTYLERVLNTANNRLQHLTNDRYRFVLADKPGSGRGKSGLDINIYDDNVGKDRSVNTLSGGESFIAALALALGLAEVIQNQAGGIKIEALFIDEGFGSLDEDALDRAMDTLQSMESGSRMIGIISHVRELRAQIPGQLIVSPNGNGESTVSYKTEVEV